MDNQTQNHARASDHVYIMPWLSCPYPVPTPGIEFLRRTGQQPAIQDRCAPARQGHSGWVKPQALTRSDAAEARSSAQRFAVRPSERCSAHGRVAFRIDYADAEIGIRAKSLL